MVSSTSNQNVISQFPEQKVKDALVDWWESEVSSRKKDPFARANTLYDTIVEMDSLSMVNALLSIEKVGGFKPPVTVIKRGGYRSRQEMVDHLVPVLQKEFKKQRNITPKRKASDYAKRS